MPQSKSKRLWLVALLMFVLMVAVIGRLIAPSIIERVVESSLEDMPGGYRGTLEGVDLRMLSAEVALLGLKIEKKTGKIPVPFLHAKELVVGTVRDSWKLRSTLRAVEPTVSIVDAKNAANKQTGPEFKIEELREKLPFDLTAVIIEGGQVHFRNFESKPAIDAYVHAIDVAWTKLAYCLPPGATACHSELKGDATLMKSGYLTLQGRFDRSPRTLFDARVNVRDLRVAQLSPVLRQYAEVDVKRGVLDLEAHYVKHESSQTAFIVPKLDDFEVLGSDAKDVSFMRQLGVAAATGWFERKSGKKAVSLKSKPGGGWNFEIVDLPKKSADTQKD